ncbi:uncharacterized protein LOC111264159 isoform X2 [Varroa jacobsoni]|uniref:SEA domain-containing protein n=1 Tax=Varroa destructor TaxID=109461 RepID=A0A7M7JKS1_VARDE|nr:uncharacterized protein LOC111246499 isoform X2 [Varroa destructor]XP_022695556.1 uncharacterized protein LOC111264159 isoform X2 [Varroa jacobsoni]
MTTNDRLYSVIPCHVGTGVDPSLTTMGSLGTLGGLGVQPGHPGHPHIYHTLGRPVPPVPQSKRKTRLKPILIVVCATFFVIAAISIALVASLSGIAQNQEKSSRSVTPIQTVGSSSRFHYQAPAETQDVDVESMALPPSHLQQASNVVDANFRIVNRRFTPDLHNPNAFPFKSLASELKRAMDELFYLGKLSDDYNHTQVISFREGLVVQTRLTFNRRVSLAEVSKAFYGVLRQDHGHLPTGFQVDVRSLKFSVVRQAGSMTVFPTSTSQPSAHWSAWSAWSSCTRTDQICVRSRRRTCLAQRAGDLCPGGKEVEFEECRCPPENAQPSGANKTKTPAPPPPPPSDIPKPQPPILPEAAHKSAAATATGGTGTNGDLPNESCHVDEWKCGNGQCIPDTNRCDGHTNCYDSSDERDCECAGLESGTHFRCGNATSCLPVGKRCDGVVDCWDDSDEENCLCPPDQHRCELAGTCIPRTFFCDGFADCPSGDRSDEPPNCDAFCAGDNFRQCANGRCVPKEVWCDGYDSCGDGSDEKDC